jgi:hypothetical protein
VLATIHLSWGSGFLLAAADDLTRDARQRVGDWWSKQAGVRGTAGKLRSLLG